MSDIDTIPDDIHSLISLSSSTIGSNRFDDVESTDSQDYNVAGSRERLKQFIDAQGKSADKRSDAESRINSYLLDTTTKNTTDNLSEELLEETQELDEGTEEDKTDENPFLKSVKYLEQEGILRLFQVRCRGYYMGLWRYGFYLRALNKRSTTSSERARDFQL